MVEVTFMFSDENPTRPMNFVATLPAPVTTSCVPGSGVGGRDDNTRHVRAREHRVEMTSRVLVQLRGGHGCGIFRQPERSGIDRGLHRGLVGIGPAVIDRCSHEAHDGKDRHTESEQNVAAVRMAERA